MAVLLCLIVFILSITCPQALAGTTNQQDSKGPSSEASSNAFDRLDQFFVDTYGPLSRYNQLKSRPLLVVEGSTFKLLEEDGSVKSTAGKVRDFYELKGLAHLGPCVYAIGARSWEDPRDQNWLATMSTCKQNVEGALAQVDSIDWSSDAWPGGADTLKEFVRASLKTVKDFANSRITSKSFSRADYETFARAYYPVMNSAFYLETLNGTYGALRILKEWKASMGEKKWNGMYAVIAGSPVRPTGGLTPETNPAALIIASLMDPAQASSHIIMAPAAATSDQALPGLGNALTAIKLADAMFPTAEAQKAGSSFYYALNHCEIPLALDNVRSIISSLRTNDAKDPVLGLGPKK